MYQSGVMSDRLATHIWVDALRRRVSLNGASAFIVQKGDRERGDVLIKIARLNGQAAYLSRRPMTDEEFDWLPHEKKWSVEADVDAAINRRRQYDPDLWIVEIEDPEGRHFLTESVHNTPDGEN